MVFIIKILLFLNSPSFSYEKADAYIVKAHDDYYRVVSPTRYYKNSSVLIENKTLTKIVGRIESNYSDKVINLAIAPGKIKSTRVDLKKGELLYFVPLSPPFQKVILKLGKKPYEIPPKK